MIIKKKNGELRDCCVKEIKKKMEKKIPVRLVH